MRVITSRDVAEVNALIDPVSQRNPRVERRVRRIVADVRERGDEAVREYARQLDGLDGPTEVTLNEMHQAARTVSPDVRRAIALAAKNIRRLAVRQLPRGWRTTTSPGVTIEQRVSPLDRVGCYVPGGRYPLPSSLLMTAVPARTAGVKEIVAVCPRPDATVMLAALETGVDRLLRIGGAHAIAALAYGTRRLARVDKIVGPGNRFVAAAKALVSSDCAIDFFAGPTEIVIVSTTGRPDWIAADLIAQAEHDPDARAILLTPSRRLARAVTAQCRLLLRREDPAAAALRRHGVIILTRSTDEAIILCQRIAPEHVVCDNDAVARRLTRAGTVFVGRQSAQALGDYITGSNHVLPTAGAARARGGLSAADFVRVTNVQRVNRRGLAAVGRAAIALARAEGLEAHARSIEIRLKPQGKHRGNTEKSRGKHRRSDRGNTEETRNSDEGNTEEATGATQRKHGKS